MQFLFKGEESRTKAGSILVALFSVLSTIRPPDFQHELKSVIVKSGFDFNTLIVTLKEPHHSAASENAGGV